jgi:hypothetical protein
VLQCPLLEKRMVGFDWEITIDDTCKMALAGKRWETQHHSRLNKGLQINRLARPN